MQILPGDVDSSGQRDRDGWQEGQGRQAESAGINRREVGDERAPKESLAAKPVTCVPARWVPWAQVGCTVFGGGVVALPRSVLDGRRQAE